ncbi:MAG: PadR family transcriptional regulator [Candidatus Heimdallarchaeota archaeon]
MDKIAKPIAPTYVALLLILAEGPAHAWHIKKVLEDRGFEEWVDMKKSTIYKSLGKLESKGFIIGQKEEEKFKLSKKIYEITEHGKETLHEQIQLCIKNPPKPKTMFDLGLAGLSLLTKSTALSVLEEYKTNMKYSIQWFESILQQFESLDEIVKTDPDRMIAGMPAKELQKTRRLYLIKALFERPYHSIRAQKNWLEGFIQSIKEDKGQFEFQEE